MTAGQSARDALTAADEALLSGREFAQPPYPTGFAPLDACLGGGIRAGDLVLVGGAQGLGKTTFALQIARNVVAAGGHAVYACYEHGERELLERLIGMEAGLLGGAEAMPLDRIRRRLRERASPPANLSTRLASDPFCSEAVGRIRGYGDRLTLLRASGAKTGVSELRELVSLSAAPPLLVVDYLQKIAVPGDTETEDERVTKIVEALKDLALDLGIALLAIVAADRQGIAGGRTRLHHLRGSTALAYEADVALILNDKFGIVARHHLVYGTVDVDRFHKWVVCSVEKNRSGLAAMDLEFRKLFEHGRFDPNGARVAEQLIDDRIYRE